MRINEYTTLKSTIKAITPSPTTTLSLVPYTSHHVPIYHEWMSDSEIQAATASEPLSLGEEYEMCERWRGEGDKLTFIIERADGPGDGEGIGDVNLFISMHELVEEEENEGDDEVARDGNAGNRKAPSNPAQTVIGELELMIANKQQQRRGYGRAAILMFLLYILSHEQEIMKEYFTYTGMHEILHKKAFDYFAVKIGNANERSMRLFEGLGFGKVREEANYFGEFELRLTRGEVTGERIKGIMGRYGVGGLEEGRYVGQA